MLLMMFTETAFAVCNSYAPYTVYFASENSGLHIMDPDDFEAPLASAVTIWEDDDITIGADPDLTIAGEHSVNIATDFWSAAPAVLNVVVLDETGWAAQSRPSTVIADVEIRDISEVSGVCSFHTVMFIRGEVDWDGALPASLAPPTYSSFSLEGTLIHELGHALGQIQHTTEIGTLQADYPFLVDSDLGSASVSNDATAAIRTYWPGSSEGVNLTLWPFYPYDDLGDGQLLIKETWTNDSAATDDPDGLWATGVDERWFNQATYSYGEATEFYPDCRPPGPFVATATGVGSSLYPDVVVAFTEDPDACSPTYWANEIPAVEVSTDVATLIRTSATNSSDFYTTPLEPGYYYLCAIIDPYDDIEETDETDNVIVGDELFEILDDEVDPPTPCIPMWAR